ncbi:MAG: diaminopimelate epimerase [Lentimicrobiaceae bacterium]|nr:diaminopimelate epimerase [Lentimicrobiaceae bacterium]
MLTEFFKYQGTGNDFIMIDNRTHHFVASQHIIRTMCDRRWGIGADGLILLEEDSKYPFRMVYFNSDGSEATMCGNGGRCIIAFACKLNIIEDQTYFLASDGEHFAKVVAEAPASVIVSLKMQDVLTPQQQNEDWILNTGTPHFVRFVSEIDHLNVYDEGKKIRYSEPFANYGINVNFVKITDNNLTIRTYEKGVENETLSCGTGATASAIAASYKVNSSEFNVTTRGGKLNVRFTKIESGFSDVWLEGAATFVFKGEYPL